MLVDYRSAVTEDLTGCLVVSQAGGNQLNERDDLHTSCFNVICDSRAQQRMLRHITQVTSVQSDYIASM